MYEACVAECAKSQKYYKLYTQGEVKLATLEGEKGVLREECAKLQGQVRQLKEQQSRESDSVLKTVIDQQRTID